MRRIAKSKSALEIAKRVIPPHLHASAVAHPPPHRRQKPDARAHPLTEHLLALHDETLRDANEDDADVLFHADGSAGPHALVVQVRSGKVVRVLTRA